MRWLAGLLLVAGCATPAPQPPPDPAIEKLTKQLDAARDELLLAKAALKEANFWIGEYRKRFGDINGGGRSGRVQSVQDEIVAIGLGAEDVRVGDIYHIRRGATYVGQIRINKVGAKASSGVFDDESAGDGARRLGSLISFTRTMDEERSPRTQESPS